MENYIKEKVLLLNKKGHLNYKGYSTKMNFIYNKENIKCGPFKLKEWNFYQLIKNNYVVQLTIGHVSYATSVTATLIDLNTGVKDEINVMKFFNKPKLDLNPENESLNEFIEKDFNMTFEVLKDKRILKFKGSNKKYKDVDIYLELKNDVDNEKMVIATPFKRKNQFYLNYKENYYIANGYVRFDDKEIDFNLSTGLLDWGRGVWPYKHEWFWGSLSYNCDEYNLGFNIGWGFGDLSNATENMYFYNNKAYKVGELIVKRNIDNYMDKWVLYDKDENIYLEFSPTYDNYTENKLVVVDTHCNQVYGKFKGYIKVNDKKIEINNLLGFIEHAVNRW